MKSLKLSTWALLVVALTDLPAQAAWNNVFQPTCCGIFRRPRTSNYVAPVVVQSSPVVAVQSFAAPADPCPQPCPPQPCQQCTTNYVQRCYYQPVTTYESRSFYEPVTTYQTSYFYEPVTTYSYSFYVDPCTGCVTPKACPQTSFKLRSQCSPVQSWVQRCAQVPVTTLQKSFYLEPQTTCTTTTVGAPIPVAAACPTQPCPTTQPQAPAAVPPVIDHQRTPPSGPNVGATTNYRPSYYPLSTTNSNWQPAAPVSSVPASASPLVTLASIAPESGPVLSGQVTRNDRAPRAQAHVLLVNTATGARHAATTNDVGRFHVTLASGNYYVYLATNSGAAYHSQVQVLPNQANFVSLVNQ